MSNVKYTLYSDEKKKIMLTFYREVITDVFRDNDGSVRILSAINGSGEYTLDETTEKFIGGDSFIAEKGRSFTLKSNGDMEIFVMKFNLSDFIDGDYKVFKKSTLDKFFAVLETNTDKINGVHLNGKNCRKRCLWWKTNSKTELQEVNLL